MKQEGKRKGRKAHEGEARQASPSCPRWDRGEGRAGNGESAGGEVRREGGREQREKRGTSKREIEQGGEHED